MPDKELDSIELDEIKREVDNVMLAMEAEERHYRSKMLWLSATLRAIRSGCPHSVVKRYPDPSGNRDNATFCQVCGESL